MIHILLVTGMSGSGKSVALRVLEDAGYYVVDNLPVGLIPDLINALKTSCQTHIAIGVDIRSGISSLHQFPQIVRALKELSDPDRQQNIQTLFLTADTPTLVARFSETRRRHPLALLNHDHSLEECINQERDLLECLDGSGIVIDTSRLPAQALRTWIRSLIDAADTPLALLFESFAYKDGVPLDADLVFDVRCLPNPYYQPSLRALTGHDTAVCAFLNAVPAAAQMLDDIQGFVTRWLPEYIRDRHYLTVAVGCTGGQHRSVYCVEMLAQRFHATRSVLVRHRALDSRLAIPIR